MNVAPTNVTQPSLSVKGDPSAAATTARIVPDGTGTDLPVDVTPDQTFGRILSRGMTGLEDVLQGKTVKPLTLPGDPGVPVVGDGSSGSSNPADPSTLRTGPTDRSRGFGVAVTDLVDAASTAARATKTADDGTNDGPAADDGSRHDDAAANDLAAQLALVSQWAGIAKPQPLQAVPGTPGAPGARAAGSLDLRDQLATARGAAASSSASALPAASTSSEPALPAASSADTSALPVASSTDATTLPVPSFPIATALPVASSTTATPAPVASPSGAVALPVISSTPRTAPESVGARADQPQDASPLPFATPLQAFARPERGVEVGPKASATAKTDPMTVRTTDAIQASGALAAMPGEPGAVRTPSDSIVTPTSAFAQQIAAATTAIAAPLPADVSGVPTLNIREQVGTSAWSREVGQATLRIATSDVQSASLQINPEHLGPVDVQVRIDNGVAHLSFNAAHADTRQALESSRATLDRLFADQGLKIGDCAVGDSSTSRRDTSAEAALAGQSQRNSGGRWDQASGRDNAAGDTASTATITTRLKALGMVDTFA